MEELAERIEQLQGQSASEGQPEETRRSIRGPRLAKKKVDETIQGDEQEPVEPNPQARPPEHV